MSEEHNESRIVNHDILDALVSAHRELLRAQQQNNRCFFAEYDQTPHITNNQEENIRPYEQGAYPVPESTTYTEHDYTTSTQQTNEQKQQSNVVHKCYICDSNILKHHALGMYDLKKNKHTKTGFIPTVNMIDQETKQEFNKMWKSKHIKFMCCTCVEKMNKLDKDRKEEISRLQMSSSRMSILGFNTLDLNVIIDELKDKLENKKLPHFIELKELHEQLKKKHSNFTPWYTEPTRNINTIHTPVYIFEQPYDNEYHVLNGTLQINAGIGLDNDISQPYHIYFIVSKAIRECRYSGIVQPTIIIYSNNETQQEALQHIHEPVNVSEYDRIIQRADVENWLVDNRIQQNRMYFICRKNQNRENLFMCIKTGELTLSRNND